MIFVFGSNLSGIHGAGAAKYAAKHYGAVYGVGEGMSGKSYALPTKGINISFMTLIEVKPHIQKFIKYAYDHPNDKFQLTQVGCGLGGFRKEEITPLFINASSNIYYDEAWKSLLPQSAQFWGTF